MLCSLPSRLLPKLNELGSGDYTNGGFSADEQDTRATASEIWRTSRNRPRQLPPPRFPKHSTYTMAAPALSVSPSSFVFDLEKMPSNRTMRLSNDKAGSGTLAFKVMTTNRDRYRVKPTTGVLQPGQEIDVLLILSIPADVPLPSDVSAWSKDKFMVKAVAVAPGSLEEAVKERWASTPAIEVQQVKLGCAHRLPGEDSPVVAAASAPTEAYREPIRQPELAPKLKLPLKRHAEKLLKARDLDGVHKPSLKLLGLDAPN